MGVQETLTELYITSKYNMFFHFPLDAFIHSDSIFLDLFQKFYVSLIVLSEHGLPISFPWSCRTICFCHFEDKRAYCTIIAEYDSQNDFSSGIFHHPKL